MDIVLYVAIGATALTVLVGIAAIVNAILLNKRMHSQGSADRRAVV